MRDVKRTAVAIVAAAMSIAGGFAGLMATQNIYCGCEYGNCGCRPVGTPHITPQQLTPLGPTLIPYVSPTRPTVTLPVTGYPTLPVNPTFALTVLPTFSPAPTWTPEATQAPDPTETPFATPTSIVIATPTQLPTGTPTFTPTPTITPTNTPTPTPTQTPTPTNTPTPTPQPTPISCAGFALVRQYGANTMLVRYTTPPLASPGLQVLPTVFSVGTYAGYIGGAHEWPVTYPSVYFGLVTLRVYDGSSLVAECNFTWDK